MVLATAGELQIDNNKRVGVVQGIGLIRRSAVPGHPGRHFRAFPETKFTVNEVTVVRVGEERSIRVDTYDTLRAHLCRSGSRGHGFWPIAQQHPLSGSLMAKRYRERQSERSV